MILFRATVSHIKSSQTADSSIAAMSSSKILLDSLANVLSQSGLSWVMVVCWWCCEAVAL